MTTIEYDYLEKKEQLIKANKEKAILLSISKEVSAVKSKEDLFPIINNTLKNLFSYDDGVICVVNEDKITHSAYLYNPEEVFAKYPGCEQLAEMKFSIHDGVYDAIVASEQVIIFELEEVQKLPNASVYIPFWIEKGMKQLIGVPLRTGLYTIGSFSFYTKKRDPIPREEFGLLYGICSQVAIAIQNVTFNENVRKRDHEKTVLLEISSDLALSKTKNDLIAVVQTKLTKILRFTNAVIGLIDSHQGLFNLFVGETNHSNGTSIKNIAAPRQIPNKGELQSQLLVTNFPEAIKFDDKESSFYSFNFLKDLTSRDATEMAIVSLRGENGLIGFLALIASGKNNFKNADLSLIKGVACQVSSAAGNILAKEDILKKEQEKTLLLSFSNHLATVRDSNGLKFVIKQFLKKLFQINEYLITIRNDDRTYGYFLHDLTGDDPNDEGFKIITSSSMPVKGSLTGAVLKSDEPVKFNIREIIRENKYSFPAASFWKAAGAENIQGIRLKVANEDIGILWIQDGIINDRLLKGISSQIAIALANVMANLEVERQFLEIKKYKQQLQNENSYLQEEIETNYNHSEIIGTGPEMQKIYKLMSQVAFANSTVLILGETGTGKELIARAIHNNSPRKDKLMVKVNCAALPPSLIESELFGHERGAFTGATDQKIGKFELANNGTLFLDEIGEMPLELQVKFLRALQEREIERIGGKKTINIDVRIIAATNRDLQKEVKDGRFRSDLFYRLNVFPIVMPPLRKRVEDIPILVNHFIARLARSTGKQVDVISQKAMQKLIEYNWPGNIRELEHLIERSLLLTTGNTIKEVQLPIGDRRLPIELSENDAYKTIEENERDHIISVLKVCNGKIFGKGGASEILGVPASTLNSKIRKLNIKKDRLFN